MLAGPSFAEEWVSVNIVPALQAVAAEARKAGLSDRTIAGAYEAPARAVLRYLSPALSLGEIGTEAVCAMVRRCQAENLTACTIRRNYLRVLRLAFMEAGCPDEENPVHLCLRKMRRSLRVVRPPIEFFEPEELHALLARVDAYRSPSGRRLRCQPRDLALFRLVAFRGIRAGELERVQIERDVDYRACTLRVESKVTTLPRIVRLSVPLRDDVITLAAGRRDGPLVEGGMRRMNSVCETWKRRLREPRLNLRNLRRSMATALDAAGAPVASIGAALGHRAGSPVTNRYLGEVRRATDAAFRRIEHLGPPDDRALPAPLH